MEDFCNAVKQLVGEKEYTKLMEKSVRRFHPDRWGNRRVLSCVEDGEEKECLEAAANIASQALTPLWQEATGR